MDGTGTPSWLGCWVGPESRCLIGWGACVVQLSCVVVFGNGTARRGELVLIYWFISWVRGDGRGRFFAKSNPRRSGRDFFKYFFLKKIEK
jgi:hypothetical protein